MYSPAANESRAARGKQMTRSRHTMVMAVAMLVLTSLLITAGISAQGGAAVQGAAVKPQLSEDAFKNVQVLKGIPVREFMNTMGFFAASLSLNCTDCHGSASASDWAKYATDTPLNIR